MRRWLTFHIYLKTEVGERATRAEVVEDLISRLLTSARYDFGTDKAIEVIEHGIISCHEDREP